MNLDDVCENNTAMVVRPFVLMDRHGYDVAVLVAKLSWSVSARGEVRYAVPQRPVRGQDLRQGSDPHASLLLPSDRVDEKPGTDVIMLASAVPSADQQVSEQEVSLRLEAAGGAIAKTVKVFGPRVFAKGVVGLSPGPAEPLTVTPLVYERAAGGVDTSEPSKGVIDPRNPAGRGVAIDKSALIGSPAPQIVCVGGQQPAGFGPIACDWSPRAERSGTHDEAWMRTRMPVRPTDFDPRHNCCGHPDLYSDEPLTGTEPVEVLGATPQGSWRFKLPAYGPRFSRTIDGHTEAVSTHLDTFLIDADAGEVELTWRASVRLPKKTERLQAITVWEDPPMDEAIWKRAKADLEVYRASVGEGRA